MQCPRMWLFWQVHSGGARGASSSPRNLHKNRKQQRHGEYIVLLKDGTELTLSRTYREKILGLLGY